MNRFPIRQKHHSKIPVAHFRDSGPAANSAILLNLFRVWLINNLPDPLFPDYGTVGTVHAGFEIVRRFHPVVLSEVILGEYRMITSNVVSYL